MISSYSIVPQSYEKGIPRLLKLGLAYLVFPLVLILLCIFRIISLGTCLIFSCIFLFIVFFLLILSVPFYKIALSRVHFEDQCASVCDRSGRAWRVIPYNDITDIKIIELEGFMHGYHGVDGRTNYIVVFLNGCTVLPDGSFYSKYRHSDFFPICYSEDLYTELLKQWRNIPPEDKGTVLREPY